MNEQAELMRDTVREFAEKNIKDMALKIEREGIDHETFEKIVAQGFLGANLPEQDGGAGLDPLSHKLLLFELARVSPSVAVHVFLHNDIVLRLLSTGKKKELLHDVMLGKQVFGVYWPTLMEGSELQDNAKVLERTLNSACEYAVELDSDGTVYLTHGKADRVVNFKPLGMRGLGICNFTPESREKLGKKDDLEKLLQNSSGDIAAIFLGLSEGALDLAVEYTKVRKTFNQPLKNYEPVAFRLTELISELNMMKEVLFQEDASEIRELMLKNLAAPFSKRATKYALQFHGGYGYLEDFGVEKFYRDSVALNSIIYRPINDKRFLATKIYGEKSGFL